MRVWQPQAIKAKHWQDTKPMKIMKWCYTVGMYAFKPVHHSYCVNVYTIIKRQCKRVWRQWRNWVPRCSESTKAVINSTTQDHANCRYHTASPVMPLVTHWVPGRSQKFALGGINFYCTILQSYILAAWRHWLQLVHKKIFRDWFWEGIYIDIPPPPIATPLLSTSTTGATFSWPIMAKRAVIHKTEST